MAKNKFFILLILLFFMGCSVNGEDNSLIATDEVNSVEETPQFTEVSATPTIEINEDNPEPTVQIPDLPSGQILFYSSKSGDIGLLTLPLMEKMTLLNKGSDDVYDLLFVVENQQIIINSLAGLEIFDLTTNSLYEIDTMGLRAYKLALSPEEDEVVFVGRDENSEGENLYILNLISGSIEQITTGDNHFFNQPTWSPTGDRIAYISVNSGDSSDLVVVDLASKNQEVLIRDIARENGGLSWNSDGETIALTVGEIIERTIGEPKSPSSIAEYDLATQELIQIPTPEMMRFCYYPQYSEDSRLLFLCKDDIEGSTSIYFRSQVTNDVEHIITFQAKTNYATLWNYISIPGTNYLIFSYDDSETFYPISELYLIDILGKSIVQLTESENIRSDFLWIDSNLENIGN